MSSTPLLLFVASAATAAAATRPCPAGWDEVLAAGSMRCVRVSAGNAAAWDVAAGDCPLAVFETRAELDATGTSALLAEGEAYWVGAQLDATLQGFAVGPRWLPRGSRAVEGGTRVPAFPGGEHLLSVRDDHVLINPLGSDAVLCASVVRNATLPRGYNVVFAQCSRALRAICAADSFELAVADDDAAGRVLEAPETVDVRLDEASGIFFVLGAAPEDEAAAEEGSAVELGDVTHTAAAPNVTGERAAPLLRSSELTVWVVEAPPTAVAAATATKSPAGTQAPEGSSPEEAVPAPFLPHLNVTWGRTAFEVASVDLSRAHDYFVRRRGDFVEVWVDGVLVKKAAWLPGRGGRGGFGSVANKQNGTSKPPTRGVQVPVVVTPGPASVANLTFFDRSAANFTAAAVAALTVSSTERTSAHTDGLVPEQTVGECHAQLIADGQAGFILRPFAEACSHARCKARCLQDPLCDGYALALASARCWLFVADEGGSAPAASGAAGGAAFFAPSALAEPARCGRRVRATVGSMSGTAHVDVPVANASSDAAACAAYGLEPLPPTACGLSAFHASTAAGECMSASGGHVRCEKPWPRQLTGAGCGAFEKPSDLGPPAGSGSWTPLAACPRELWWVSYRLQFKKGPSKVAAVTVVAPPGQVRQTYGVYACVSQYDTDYWRHRAEAEGDEGGAAVVDDMKAEYHGVARDLRCLLVVECETAPDPQSAVRYQYVHCKTRKERGRRLYQQHNNTHHHRKTTCPMNVHASIIRVHVKSVGWGNATYSDEKLLPSLRNLEIEASESGVPPGTPAPPPEITFESTDLAAKVLSAILAALSTLMFSCGLFSHVHKLKLCRPSAIHTEEGPVIPAGVC